MPELKLVGLFMAVKARTALSLIKSIIRSVTTWDVYPTSEQNQPMDGDDTRSMVTFSSANVAAERASCPLSYH